MRCKTLHRTAWPMFAVLLGISLPPLRARSESPLPPLPQSADPQEPMLVGVLELEAISVTPDEARGITERLRTWLIRTRTFTVIERGRMAEILEEQGFQGSGACDTDECVVQVGRILGVRKMVAGSVSRVGTIFSLSIRLIDVQSGRIELESFKDVSGGIEEVLLQATQEVANELAARVRGETGEPQPTAPAGPTTAQITIQSTPPGAAIAVDSRDTGQTTPATITLTAGGHDVTLTAEGYRTNTQSILVTAGEDATHRFPLLAVSRGYLSVTTDPPGATVLINGIEAGRTPLPRHALAEGTHSVEVRLAGHEPQTRQVAVQSGSPVNLDLRLVRSGSGRITLQNALAGSVLLVGGDEEQRATLGSPAHELDLPPGTYLVTVRAKGYGRWQREIELGDGDALTFPLLHHPKSRFAAGLFSLIVPGTGQAYFGRPGRGFITLAAGAAAIAYGLSNFDRYAGLRDDYNSLRADYAAATVYADLVAIKADLDETYTELQSERDELGTAVGVIGLVWFLNVVDAALLQPRARALPGAGGAPGSAASPELVLDTRNSRLSLCLRVPLRP